jgi:beta-N-acetylhexosaminidase
VNNHSRSVIFGVSGPDLSDDERRFFADADPLGFILFSRNCASPDQVRALVSDLREVVGRADAPVLIDQEGGRVARLGPPHWRAAPSAARFADIACVDESLAVEAARLNARLLAAELADLGINIDCAPVLDIPQPGAHQVIGDRAFGGTPEQVARLGRATCEGLLAGGVLPVIKHLPGHGRATADSHFDLPVVDAARGELDRVDFAPFRALNAMPWAMTAHVVYTALDPSAPATTSSVVIERVIRGTIGFDGVLISDDLCMRALEGPADRRAEAALAAGCDIALHCNGVLAEMEAVAAACPPLTPASRARLSRAEAMRLRPEPFDVRAALERLDAMLKAPTG